MPGTSPAFLRTYSFGPRTLTGKRSMMTEWANTQANKMLWSPHVALRFFAFAWFFHTNNQEGSEDSRSKGRWDYFVSFPPPPDTTNLCSKWEPLGIGVCYLLVINCNFGKVLTFLNFIFFFHRKSRTQATWSWWYPEKLRSIICPLVSARNPIFELCPWCCFH